MRKMAVLLIGSDPALKATAQQLFSPSYFMILARSDEQEAYLLLSKIKFDLILYDLRLGSISPRFVEAIPLKVPLIPLHP